jgi:serine/threonine protein kinase
MTEPDPTAYASAPQPRPELSPGELLGRALETKPITGDPRGWEPPNPETLEAQLPGYQVDAFLARGGMGAVYRGLQISLARPVAIKILPPELRDSDPHYSARFKQEARAMAQLNHPSIVAVYDFGEMGDGTFYFIMEFIDGTDVGQRVAQQGRLASAHAMAITAHVCDALQYAHERGIVHRDIKPANIMVGFDGRVKVADFGLAKSFRSRSTSLTQSGYVMGTPHFVAPEALMLGSSIDHRADIFAMGVMLYQMLTGKVPHGLFEMPSLQVPGLDPRYDVIISSAMREDREKRYQSVLEMRRALDGILTQPVLRSEIAKQTVPVSAVTQTQPTTEVTPPKPQSGQHYYRPPQVSAPTPAPKRSKKAIVGWIANIAALVLVLCAYFPPAAQSPPETALDPTLATITPVNKTDSEVAVRQWLASPQHMREFGGWTVVGNARLSMDNGALTIESNGGRAGIVSVLGDFTKHVIQCEVAASSDVSAWVGVKVAEKAGKWNGYTSNIIGKDNMVLAGSGGCQFAPNPDGDHEGGMGKARMQPGQYFTLTHEINKEGALWTKVDGKTTSGVVRGVPTQGHIGLFVSAGKLTVKAMTIIGREPLITSSSANPLTSPTSVATPKVQTVVTPDRTMSVPTSPPRPTPGTFTDTKGRSIKAFLVSVKNDDVTLKLESGQQHTIKASTLCQADIDYLKTQGLVMPQTPTVTAAAVPASKPARIERVLDPVNMLLKDPWIPNNIHTRKVWLEHLAFYSREVMRNGSGTPSTIWREFTWLMPLSKATNALPRGSYKLKTVSAAKLAFPEGVTLEFWHVGGKGYEDDLEHFDEIVFVLDDANRLISLQLSENNTKNVIWKWRDKLTWDGDRNPYYNFMHDRSNGKNGRLVKYQFRPASSTVTNVKLVLEGSESNHWYLTAPLADKLIQIFEAVGKQGL